MELINEAPCIIFEFTFSRASELLQSLMSEGELFRHLQLERLIKASDLQSCLLCEPRLTLEGAWCIWGRMAH
jgi:hypothetical protein